MRCIFLIILPLLLCAQNVQGERQEFLTQYEYGKALYKNPRNIGCIKCHGNNGEGAVISYTKQGGKNKPITAPVIRGATFDKIENALKNGKGFMPKYNLSTSEMVALYIFLNSPQKAESNSSGIYK